jgi:hypothetical protein
MGRLEGAPGRSTSVPGLEVQPDTTSKTARTLAKDQTLFTSSLHITRTVSALATPSTLHSTPPPPDETPVRRQP